METLNLQQQRDGVLGIAKVVQGCMRADSRNADVSGQPWPSVYDYRYIAAYLAHKLTGVPLIEVGRIFGMSAAWTKTASKAVVTGSLQIPPEAVSRITKAAREWWEDHQTK